MDLRLATLKAVCFYLLHSVSALNQCRKLSCGIIVCKHFAVYQGYPNCRWDLIRLKLFSIDVKRSTSINSKFGIRTRLVVTRCLQFGLDRLIPCWGTPSGVHEWIGCAEENFVITDLWSSWDKGSFTYFYLKIPPNLAPCVTSRSLNSFTFCCLDVPTLFSGLGYL
jgi:hypothetical protein